MGIRHALLLGAVWATVASGDSGDDARADYARARDAVQEFEDAALEATSSISTPELIARHASWERRRPPPSPLPGVDRDGREGRLARFPERPFPARLPRGARARSGDPRGFAA